MMSGFFEPAPADESCDDRRDDDADDADDAARAGLAGMAGFAGRADFAAPARWAGLREAAAGSVDGALAARAGAVVSFAAARFCMAFGSLGDAEAEAAADGGAPGAGVRASSSALRICAGVSATVAGICVPDWGSGLSTGESVLGTVMAAPQRPHTNALPGSMPLTSNWDWHFGQFASFMGVHLDRIGSARPVPGVRDRSSYLADCATSPAFRLDRRDERGGRARDGTTSASLGRAGARIVADEIHDFDGQRTLTRRERIVSMARVSHTIHFERVYDLRGTVLMWLHKTTPRATRRWPRAAAVTVGVTFAALLPFGPGSEPGRAADPPRVGLFLHDERPDFEEAAAGVREGFALAHIEPVLLERHSRGDEGAARAALAEMELEGVRLVLALGPEAAIRARDGFRRGGVVHTAVAEPEALGLSGTANTCGTPCAVPAQRLAQTLARAVPGAPLIAMLVPRGSAAAEAAAERLERALQPAGASVDRGTRFLRVTPAADGADDRAVEVARELPQDTRILLVPPDVPASDVEALAGALLGRGIVLAGSRRAHLDAGCAFVVRTDPRALGALAVVAARRLIDGEAPSSIRPRPVRRVLVEVDLNAAARLEWTPPLTLLAAADHVVPRFVRSRR